MPPPDARRGRPLVISHRTNMATMPENSFAGIEAALRDGADGVEIDVRATADAVPVLLHDESLARTTGDPRRLSSLTLDDLAGLRLSSAPPGIEPQPIPTLARALAAVRGRAVLVVEVKERGLEHAVARAIVEAGAESWCWIWAFDPEVARACRLAMPAIPVGLNAGPGSALRYGYASPVEAAAEAGLAAVSLHRRLVDERTVAEAHGCGLRVHTWTVNEPDEVVRVAAAGVDAVCGDDPLLIARTLEAQRGLR